MISLAFARGQPLLNDGGSLHVDKCKSGKVNVLMNQIVSTVKQRIAQAGKTLVTLKHDQEPARNYGDAQTLLSGCARGQDAIMRLAEKCPAGDSKQDEVVVEEYTSQTSDDGPVPPESVPRLVSHRRKVAASTYRELPDDWPCPHILGRTAESAEGHSLPGSVVAVEIGSRFGPRGCPGNAAPTVPDMLPASLEPPLAISVADNHEPDMEAIAEAWRTQVTGTRQWRWQRDRQDSVTESLESTSVSKLVWPESNRLTSSDCNVVDLEATELASSRRQLPSMLPPLGVMSTKARQFLSRSANNDDSNRDEVKLFVTAMNVVCNDRAETRR